MWRPIPPTAEAARGGELRRLFGVQELTLLGIGGVVGSGVFVMTGEAAAHHAGPAVVLSFLIGALAAALAGLCYAEMASMVATSGSAYSYVRATLGELPAFVIGWNLILEYGVAASCVSVGWSKYAVDFVEQCSPYRLPWRWVQSPWAIDPRGGKLVLSGAICNLPALGVIASVTCVLLLGLRWSMAMTRAVVGVKLAVIALFIGATLPHARWENLQPFVPTNLGSFGRFGPSGVLQAATILFFTYCGFDAISTAAGECRAPQRDVPRAMLAALGFAACLYVGVAVVLCAVVPYSQLGVADPLTVGMQAAGHGALVTVVTAGALMGLTSVMLVQIFGQTRILLAICQDGLLPSGWARVTGRGVPARLTLGVAAGAGLGGALLPAGLLGELTSMGTLLAFGMVALGVMRLRITQPEAHRPFRVPGGPWGLPALAALVSLALLCMGNTSSILRLCAWTLCGLAVFTWRLARRGPAA